MSRTSRRCLQHLTKKQRDHYSYYHMGEVMDRMYMRSKEGSRKMIPNGWWCAKCKKHYTDEQIEKGRLWKRGSKNKPIFSEY